MEVIKLMKNSSLPYFIVSFIHILSIFLEHEMAIHISKVILMPLLGLYLYFNWPKNREKTFLLSILALIFSWSGDILLIFQSSDQRFFLFGIGAFLLAHILYMADYYYLQVDTGNKPNNIFIVSRILILAFVGGAMLNVLWPKLGEMKIPILIYTAIIILMAVFAVLRRDRTSQTSFSFIYGGALFFIVSDGMIAVSKYLNPFPYHDALIMITYIIAQFFIIKGVLEHNKFKKEFRAK